jgi:nucleotide-binding universal stress UspA family protein
MAAKNQQAPSDPGIWVLADVLCGVDGTRGAYEAVRQAAWFAGPDGKLTLLAVTAVVGGGVQRSASFAPARAKRALAHAEGLAAAVGVSAVSEIDERAPVTDVLLGHADGHGLLAIGAPPMSRVAHLLLGGTATPAAHLLPASVLFARRPPARVGFGDQIVVASDALEQSDALVHFATALARQRDVSLTLLHAPHDESSQHPTRIAAQVEHVTRALGDNGRVRIEPGRARDVIVATAASERCSLLVVSSRRVGGLRALGSVSERVVHDAPCSVLVMRPEDLQRDAD